MVIVHVMNDDGGVGSVIATLAKEQIAHGDTVIVHAAGQKNFYKKLPKEVIIDAAPKAKYPRMLVGYSVKKVFQRIKEQYPGEEVVVHAHNVSALGLLGPLKNVPVVTTIHGYTVLKDLEENLSGRERRAIWGTKKIIRRLAKRGLPIVAVSDAVAVHWSRISGEDCILTIRNGVEPMPSRSIMSPGLSIAYVGDLSTYKGWDKALAAFLELRKRHPEQRVSFVSAGTPLHFSRDFIEDVRIKNDIPEDDLKYLGYVADSRREVYLNSDIAVLLSKSEGLGVTLIEAMSVGLPVVATCVGGIPEVVEDGVTGYLVGNDAPTEEIVEAFEKLLDLDNRRRISQSAINKFYNEFLSSAMSEKYSNLYCEALTLVDGGQRKKG